MRVAGGDLMAFGSFHGQAGRGGAARGVAFLQNLTLDLVEAVGAGLVPASEGTPAELAGTRLDAVGVEVGVLIERDGVGGVGGAENVPAMPAVVATQEHAEGGAAAGGVAGG